MRNFSLYMDDITMMANTSVQAIQTEKGTRYLLGIPPAAYQLYSNERDSDVCIRVEYENEKWQFPAHKLILSTMSEVFRTMMNVDMMEKFTQTIIITDSSPRIIKMFLKYLYLGAVELADWNEAASLLKVAHKYGVKILVNFCESYLVSNILLSNVCFLYEISKTYDLRLLEKETEACILAAGFIVSATHGFLALQSSSIEYFLSKQSFNIENEGCLLTNLREWAVNECSRRCISLTRTNVVGVMEPFLKFIYWGLIPECHRTFIDTSLVKKYWNGQEEYRRPINIPLVLANHIIHVKYSVELGAFHKEDYFAQQSTPCLKFSAENPIFVAGFRIIGLFHKGPGVFTAPNFMILSRDDGKVFIQFNLMSLPWARGETVGHKVWKEMIAYLPYPVRIDPYYQYKLSLKSSRPVKDEVCVKWPVTRSDSQPFFTSLGTINIKSHGQSYGITQLLILPAPPFRNICNRAVYDV